MKDKIFNLTKIAYQKTHEKIPSILTLGSLTAFVLAIPEDKLPQLKDVPAICEPSKSSETTSRSYQPIKTYLW